ncbi:MAG: hypothetical protein PHV34_09250 [Verrucomicrobiae bacterium]|nr:hypothetical protein [Verrucomicrobiae bacterium]
MRTRNGGTAVSLMRMGMLFFCGGLFLAGMSSGRANELLLEYAMKEGGGKTVRDSSGYNNDGAIMGIKQVLDKESGREALEFDGERSMVKAGNVDGDTVEVWLKFADVSQEIRVVVQSAASWTGIWSNFRFVLGTRNGRVVAIVGNNGANKEGFFYLQTKKECNTGTWICVTLTLAPKEICLYLNGELEQKQEISPAFELVKAGFFVVGALYDNYLEEEIKKAERDPNAPEKRKWLETHPGKAFPKTAYDNFWQGRMGGLRVWQGVLNAGEVNAGFEKGMKQPQHK